MMSSLPSLSQSISPTPPLMDSTMYFLSGEEMCGTVRPAFCATSSNCGTDAGGAGSCAFCTGELAGGLAGAACASSIVVSSNPVGRESVHTESEARIGRGSIIQGGSQDGLGVDVGLHGAGLSLTSGAEACIDCEP